MATALEMVRSMEINTPVRGLVDVTMDAGIGFGASYGIGHVYHRFSDKWYGKKAPVIAAVVGKVGAMAFSAMGGGRQNFVGSAMNSIGQAGVNALGLEMGLRHARKATKKKAVLIADTDALPAGATELGARHHLGAAPAGRGLSWAQIEELAAGR